MKLLPAALLFCLASAATAQPKVFTVTLTGDEESPPVATTGTGQAQVIIDPTGAVIVDGIYDNLSSPVTGAHIHGSTRRGANTGVILPLMQTGGTSGAFGGMGMLTPGQANDLLNGLTYLNVHTMMNGGGELRGQIDSVPESGHPRAPYVSVSGEAKPGGTLRASCPPGIGTDFVVVGLALSPCQTIPLQIPELCPPGFALVAIDLAGPVIAFPGSNVDIPFPAGFPSIDLAIQCVTITPANCITLSGAHRVAIRP